VRVLAAAAGGASILFDDGLSEAEVVARIKRISVIDTAAEDAAIDAAVARKPPRP
jgi:hypothetical protein